MWPNDDEDILYKIAISFIPGIGPKTACALLMHFENPKAVINASVKQLMEVSGMGEVKAKAVKDPGILTLAEKELTFIKDNGIKIHFLTDENYPQRLRGCSDAPVLLYSRGNANLDAEKVVAVIGTRKNTEYGQRLTEEFIEGLSNEPSVLVTSGLAYGIDGIAHKKCVRSGVATVGVLAHGMDILYPSTHRSLANDMLQNGGLLTEFPSGTKLERTNFPVRNRIVAGMSDVTVVIESDIKGGAVITALLASSYNREVVAFPGRVFDTRSAGCNDLIQRNIAGMITSADDLLQLMNWKKTKAAKDKPKQLSLSLQPDEQKVVDMLEAKDSIHSDELLLGSGLNNSSLAATLLQLEMQGIIKALPGKLYRLN